MKKLATVFFILLSLSACAPSSSTTPTPTATPDPLQQQSDIKLQDNGGAFTFTVTSRFFVFLDNQANPVSELKCTPEAIIGIISNGSLNGPGRYPVMFEAVQPGTCTLTDREFSVQITVK
jgi:hypothetical protein